MLSLLSYHGTASIKSFFSLHLFSFSAIMVCCPGWMSALILMTLNNTNNSFSGCTLVDKLAAQGFKFSVYFKVRLILKPKKSLNWIFFLKLNICFIFLKTILFWFSNIEGRVFLTSKDLHFPLF